jgi:hypothetical protein
VQLRKQEKFFKAAKQGVKTQKAYIRWQNLV